jgi:hypothetical protein
MIDEHTRLSLMNIVERSITAERLTVELDKAFALWRLEETRPVVAVQALLP